MKTLASLYCEFRGFQACGIHDMRRDFASLDIREKDRFCNAVFRHGTVNLSLEDLKEFGNLTAIRAGSLQVESLGTCAVLR